MSTSHSQSQNTPNNAFSVLLAELRSGDTLHEASQKLTALVQAMRERCAGGELTLKIKFAPAGAGKILTITDEVIVKMPKEKSDATLMYSTDHGTLQTRDPNQKELQLREVSSPKEAPKEVHTTATAPKVVAA